MEGQGKQPSILITGASGFIGRYLVNHILHNYRIIALARRTQKEVGIKKHPNLIWMLVDITDEDQFRKAYEEVDHEYKLDYIIHLAAYYHFGDQRDSSQYYKTNVKATQQLLEMARSSNIKRFIFTSSLVASNFPEKGDLVYEESVLDATFPYALTKIEGEKMIHEASADFPCTIVRLAAVYSDWCEYEPLYNFFKVWLSDRWDARIVPGEGSMAIPYINICCVVALFERILEKSDSLDRNSTFLASSDQPTSLRKLFELATRHYYGEQKTPISIPVFVAKLGVFMRNISGHLTGRRPFERMWMTNYIDKQFPTDCSYTRNTLNWVPVDRHHIKRRILHLIENMKSRPDEWHKRNIDRLHRFDVNRPALTLAEEMVQRRDELVKSVFEEIMDPKNNIRFQFYQSMTSEDLVWNINVVYSNLLSSVRHGDRSIMLTFAKDLSMRRMEQGVLLEELCGALTVTRDVITQGLYGDPQLSKMKLQVHDNIFLAIQLAMDEIKDIYEQTPGNGTPSYH